MNPVTYLVPILHLIAPTLRWTNSLLLKKTFEIVDLPVIDPSYPLVMTNTDSENCYRNSEFPYWTWWFVYRRIAMRKCPVFLPSHFRCFLLSRRPPVLRWRSLWLSKSYHAIVCIFTSDIQMKAIDIIYWYIVYTFPWYYLDMVQTCSQRDTHI